MIRFVFLDLDDTILDFHAGERVAIAATFSEIGVEPTKEVLARYKEINRECWEALERGELTREAVLTTRFERLFREMRVDISPTETQRIYAYRLGLEHEFLEGGRELLDSFAILGKYELYIASNGIYSVQAPRIRDSGIEKYFKDIFISEKIGYNKPSREFFDICFSRIKDFKREEAIIVGDSLSSDILGGINAGIRTCYFNPQAKTLGNIIPDFEIRSLSELIPLLDSIK